MTLSFPLKSACAPRLAPFKPCPASPFKHAQTLRAPPCRRDHEVKTQAAEPGQALKTVFTSIQMTGTPVLDEMMQMAMSDATAFALMRITRTIVGVSLGTLILGAVHAYICRHERQRTDYRPILAPLVAITKPAVVLLPAFGISRVMTIVAALAQVAAEKQGPEFDALTRGYGDSALRLAKWVTQFLQDTTELVLILAVAWSVKRLKDRAVSAFQLKILREGQGDTKQEPSTLARLIGGASAALNWVIFGFAGFSAAAAYGIDVRPLVASLGASSIVVGFAAQSILSNVVAGVGIYTSGVFVVGDKIQLLSTSGGVVLKGTVQAVTPSRTVIHDEDGALTYINNSDLAKMLIKNESQAVVTSGNPGVAMRQLQV